MGIIYFYTNKLNNMKYVGQTPFNKGIHMTNNPSNTTLWRWNGGKNDISTNEKISIKLKGIKRSPETIEKMKQAQSNRTWNTKPVGSKTVAGMHWTWKRLKYGI
jgi:hypothetical protein